MKEKKVSNQVGNRQPFLAPEDNFVLFVEITDYDLRYKRTLQIMEKTQPTFFWDVN